MTSDFTEKFVMLSFDRKSEETRKTREFEFDNLDFTKQMSFSHLTEKLENL